MSQSFDRNPSYGFNYKLVIPGLESFNYFIQTTELPGMNMSGVEMPYQNHQGRMPSNRIDYDPLNVTYIVSQDYENFSQLHLWMHQIRSTEPVMAGQGPLKDITLHLLDSNKQTTKMVRFYSAFPTMLSPVPLDVQGTDASPIIATAMFQYQYYDFVNNEA